jgi:ABC-2 type transport system permease protein
MNIKYNQFTGLKAIAKASLLAILKNPGAIFFSLLFPLIFVFIFGSFGDGGINAYKVALSKNSDTNNVLYGILKNVPLIKFQMYSDTVEQKQDLEKGRLAAILTIKSAIDSSSQKQIFNLQLIATSATMPEMASLVPILENVAAKYSKISQPQQQELVTISKRIYEVRAYKQIDFVLPGQIGFSILFSTLFGISFTFYNLREQLVLKRFYASPINKLNILIGIGFSRIVFQLLNVVVLIFVGKFFLGFTLAHGIFTALQMIIISIIMLFLLMGVGLIFSSIVKTDAIIPLLINLFALPQMLLSGTFFSISVFPSWLQTFCKCLPLTHFNMAMRKLSFEGLHLTDCWQHIGILAIWTTVIYALVYKLFKWE